MSSPIPATPAKGIVFDGRVAEDFKLSTGTWVNVGELRVKLIAALDPIVQDVVVTGHDRDKVGLLIFLGPVAGHLRCFRRCGAAQVSSQPAVLDHVRAGLSRLSRGGGSSTYAARALLLQEPASIDAGEITDKGYINQARCSRAELVVKALCRACTGRVIV